MDDFRSKSYSHNNMQLQVYEARPSASEQPQYWRSYSEAYTYNERYGSQTVAENAAETKSKWLFNDPEFKRKKRVASYKALAAEGKLKASFRRSFRWLKDRYAKMIYGW